MEIKTMRFDTFQKSIPNAIVFGKVGTGMSFTLKMSILKAVEIQNIVNNHLNNNNYLKRHGEVMIRRGHPMYEACKKYKGTKPFKILFTGPEEEYEAFISHLPNDIYVEYKDSNIEKIEILTLT